MKKINSLLFLLFIVFACRQTDNKTLATEDFPFEEYTIAQLQKGYNNGDFTVEEVINIYLQRTRLIDNDGPAINSIITINPDALEIAKALDSARQKGNILGPLHGIPVVVKDNIDTHDKMPTTAGSRALAESYSKQDAFLIQKLREAGAVIIAKANLSEWANFRGQMSSSGWSGVGGQTKNPYVLTRNPCGSSAGSGAAVSANLAMLAIGTETNGSIVCPSHANGIVGIKPTVGLISRSGVIPISFTQDTPGPMARTVTDAAVGLGAMAGVDSADEKTIDSQGKFYQDYTQFLNENGLQGKRIGFFKAPLGQNYKVDTLMFKAIEVFKSKGAEIIDLENINPQGTGSHSFQTMLYEYREGLNAYFASLGAEAAIKNIDELIAFNKNDSIELSFYNQRYLEMARDIDLSNEEYQEELAKLMQGSREEGIDNVMDEHNLDAIISPTGSPAWLTDHTNGDSFQLGSSSPAAWAGYPNITVPMGFVEDLPVGMSIFGKAWSEPELIAIAYAYEQATKHRKAPQFKQQ
jgi:amidase